VKIRYLTVAEIEFDEAVAWYLARSRSAARHFGKEIRIVERLLLDHPRIGRCDEHDTRSLCVNDFPYNLIYSIEKNEIVVVAVAHHSRRPGYWIDRLAEIH
jgi:plasmid stabilization system protein ParE